MHNVTFEALPDGNIRLRWPGASVRKLPQERPGQEPVYALLDTMYADFDPCPVRGLTARASAEDWARRVLGWQGQANTGLEFP